MVREAIEGGLPIPRAAERFGIKAESIRTRSKKGQWATPGRVARGDVEVAPSKDWQSLPITGLSAEKGSSTAEKDPNPEQLILSKLEKLRNAAGSDPKVFQDLMAEIAEDRLAMAMADLDARSVSEITQLNQMVRRNRGFDVVGTKQQGFVRPLRTLTRQPAITLEAESADPLADFPI